MTVARHRNLPVRTSALALAVLLALAAFATLAAPAAEAAARARRGYPRLVFVRCSSNPFPCRAHTIATRTGKLLVGAGGMSRRAKVVFPVRSRAGGRVGLRAVGGRFRTPTRIVVRVPGNAISGVIRVANPGRKFSNAVRIGVRSPPKPPRQPSGGSAP